MAKCQIRQSCHLWAASTLLNNGLSSFHLDSVRLATSHCRLTCHPAENCKNIVHNQWSLLDTKLKEKGHATKIEKSPNTNKKKHQEYLFLISAAIVIKACSTLVASFALVSKNGMPISSAKAWVNTNIMYQDFASWHILCSWKQTG